MKDEEWKYNSKFRNVDLVQEKGRQKWLTLRRHQLMLNIHSSNFERLGEATLKLCKDMNTTAPLLNYDLERLRAT